MFLASLYIKKTCKNCIISVFYQFADHSSSRPSGDLKFHHMTLFPLTTVPQILLVKEQISLGKGWQRHMRHPLAYRKCKLLQVWEPRDVSEEKVTHSTLRPGPGNAMVGKVMEKRKPGMFREKAKREGGLEKASVRGSEPLQVEKLSQQKQRVPWEDAFPASCFYIRAKPDSGVFWVIFQLVTARLNQRSGCVCTVSWKSHRVLHPFAISIHHFFKQPALSHIGLIQESMLSIHCV